MNNPRQDPYAIIRRPVITEKSVHCAEKRRQYAFEVHPEASKHDIKWAIEKIYSHKKTEVVLVRTMNRAGKVKQNRRTGDKGRTRRWKKAVVTLAEGQVIDLY